MPEQVRCAGDCRRLIYKGRGSRPNPVCRECRKSGLYRKHYEPTTPQTVTCRCGKTFAPKPQQIHCSDSCRQGHKRALRAQRKASMEKVTFPSDHFTDDQLTVIRAYADAALIDATEALNDVVARVNAALDSIASQVNDALATTAAQTPEPARLQIEVVQPLLRKVIDRDAAGDMTTITEELA